MLTNDAKFENPFMDNDKRWQKNMNEEDINKQFTECWSTMNEAKEQDPNDWEVDASLFIKEKTLLLGYTLEMLHYSCRLQDIPVEKVCSPKTINLIKSEQTHMNIGHRIAMIVSVFSSIYQAKFAYFEQKLLLIIRLTFSFFCKD